MEPSEGERERAIERESRETSSFSPLRSIRAAITQHTRRGSLAIAGLPNCELNEAQATSSAIASTCRLADTVAARPRPIGHTVCRYLSQSIKTGPAERKVASDTIYLCLPMPIYTNEPDCCFALCSSCPCYGAVLVEPGAHHLPLGPLHPLAWRKVMPHSCPLSTFTWPTALPTILLRSFSSIVHCFLMPLSGIMHHLAPDPPPVAQSGSRAEPSQSRGYSRRELANVGRKLASKSDFPY